MQAVILAAGMGSRLHSMTGGGSKALVEIGYSPEHEGAWDELTGLEFDKFTSREENGKLIQDPAGRVTIPCDTVILAIGQENAFPWIERDLGIEFDKWEVPVVDTVTYESKRPGVFFGGDAAIKIVCQGGLLGGGFGMDLDGRYRDLPDVVVYDAGGSVDSATEVLRSRPPGAAPVLIVLDRVDAHHPDGLVLGRRRQIAADRTRGGARHGERDGDGVASAQKAMDEAA